MPRIAFGAIEVFHWFNSSTTPEVVPAVLEYRYEAVPLKWMLNSFENDVVSFR